MNNTISKKTIYGIIIIGLILLSIFYLVLESGTQSDSQKNYRVVQADSTNYNVPARPDLGGYLLKVVLVTLFIIVLIIVGARWYGKFTNFNPGSSQIRILAKHNVGPKQLLLMIRIERKKLLIGVTENSINLLSDLGESDDSEDDQYEPIQESVNFSTILKHFRKEKNE